MEEYYYNYVKKVDTNNIFNNYIISTDVSSYNLENKINNKFNYYSYHNINLSELNRENVFFINNYITYNNSSTYIKPNNIILANLSTKDNEISNSYMLYYNFNNELNKLTYIINETNGLYNDNSYHSLLFNIDNQTIKEVNNTLYFNQNALDKSANNIFGIAKINSQYFNIINGEISLKDNYLINIKNIKNKFADEYSKLQGLYQYMSYFYNYDKYLLSFEESSTTIDEINIVTKYQNINKYLTTYYFPQTKIQYIDHFWYNKFGKNMENAKNILLPIHNLNNDQTIYCKDIESIDFICQNYNPFYFNPLTYKEFTGSLELFSYLNANSINNEQSIYGNNIQISTNYGYYESNNNDKIKLTKNSFNTLVNQITDPNNNNAYSILNQKQYEMDLENSISCSDLGMININAEGQLGLSDSIGLNNANILINTLNSGIYQKIIVDDIYYIKLQNDNLIEANNAQTYSSYAINIPYDITIEGEDSDKGFITNGPLFYTEHSLIIKNLKIEMKLFSKKSFILMNCNSVIDYVSIENCKITNGVFLNIYLDYDKNTSQYINEINIQNNITNANTILVSNNLYVKNKFTILNNNFNNIINSAIKIISINENSKINLSKSSPFWIVGNNFYGSEIYNNVDENIYCAIIVDCNICVFSHNTINNFISPPTVKNLVGSNYISAYDTYINCNQLYYCVNQLSNIVKNLLSKNNKGEYGLFKSDGNIYNSNIKLIRYFKNNTITIHGLSNPDNSNIDQESIEYFFKDDDNVRNKYVNNNIDSNYYDNDHILLSNTLIGKSLLIKRDFDPTNYTNIPIYIETYIRNIDNYNIIGKYEFSNNEITVKFANLFGISHSTYTHDYETLIIKNNIFKVDSSHVYCTSNFINDNYPNDLISTNNNSNEYSIFNAQHIETFEFENNITKNHLDSINSININMIIFKYNYPPTSLFTEQQPNNYAYQKIKFRLVNNLGNYTELYIKSTNNTLGFSNSVVYDIQIDEDNIYGTKSEINYYDYITNPTYYPDYYATDDISFDINEFPHYWDYNMGCFKGFEEVPSESISNNPYPYKVFAPGERILHKYLNMPSKLITSDSVIYDLNSNAFMLKIDSTYYTKWGVDINFNDIDYETYSDDWKWPDDEDIISTYYKDCTYYNLYDEYGNVLGPKISELNNIIYSDISESSTPGKLKRTTYIITFESGQYIFKNIWDLYNDASDAIYNCLRSTNNKNKCSLKLLPNRVYMMSPNELEHSSNNPFINADNFIIDGQNSFLFIEHANGVNGVIVDNVGGTQSSQITTAFRIYNTNNGTIQNLNVVGLLDRDDGANDNHIRFSTSSSCQLLTFQGSNKNIHINNLYTKNVNGFNIKNGENIIIENWTAINHDELYCSSSADATLFLKNCNLSQKAFVGDGMHIIHGATRLLDIENCIFETSGPFTSVMLTMQDGGHYIRYRNCKFYGTKVCQGDSPQNIGGEGHQWHTFYNCEFHQRFHSQLTSFTGDNNFSRPISINQSTDISRLYWNCKFFVETEGLDQWVPDSNTTSNNCYAIMGNSEIHFIKTQYNQNKNYEAFNFDWFDELIDDMQPPKIRSNNDDLSMWISNVPGPISYSYGNIIPTSATLGYLYNNTSIMNIYDNSFLFTKSILETNPEYKRSYDPNEISYIIYYGSYSYNDNSYNNNSYNNNSYNNNSYNGNTNNVVHNNINIYSNIINNKNNYYTELINENINSSKINAVVINNEIIKNSMIDKQNIIHTNLIHKYDLMDKNIQLVQKHPFYTYLYYDENDKYNKIIVKVNNYNLTDDKKENKHVINSCYSNIKYINPNVDKKIFNKSGLRLNTRFNVNSISYITYSLEMSYNILQISYTEKTINNNVILSKHNDKPIKLIYDFRDITYLTTNSVELPISSYSYYIMFSNDNDTFLNNSNYQFAKIIESSLDNATFNNLYRKGIIFKPKHSYLLLGYNIENISESYYHKFYHSILNDFSGYLSENAINIENYKYAYYCDQHLINISNLIFSYNSSYKYAVILPLYNISGVIDQKYYSYWKTVYNETNNQNGLSYVPIKL